MAKPTWCTPCFQIVKRREQFNGGSSSEHHLQPSEHRPKLMAKYLADLQSMTVSKVSSPLMINQFQCRFLTNHLSEAVERVQVRTSSFTPKEMTECGNIYNDLLRVIRKVMRLVQDCCKEQWLQAAVRLADISEHVLQLVLELQLCTILLRNVYTRDSGIKTLDELERVVQVEAILLRKNALLDKKDLLARLTVLSKSNRLGWQESQLVDYLFRRSQVAPLTWGGVDFSLECDMSSLEVDFRSLENLQKIGGGSHGTVFKIDWLGQQFARKTFIGADDLSFKNEVKILAGLSHPNIVTLFSYAVERGRSCSVVMDLMDGDLYNLVHEISRSNETHAAPFDIDEALDIVLQIAEGMRYLHNHRVVHRDLKSANILVKRVKTEGSVVNEYIHAKVADFGLSRTKESTCTLSNQTMDTGTTRWMAPELIGTLCNRGAVDSSSLDKVNKYPFKSDVYSFGMVLYEILTGNVPFSDLDMGITGINREILNGYRPELPGQCPEMLSTLVRRCWDQDASKRLSFDEICLKLRHLKVCKLKPATNSRVPE